MSSPYRRTPRRTPPPGDRPFDEGVVLVAVVLLLIVALGLVNHLFERDKPPAPTLDGIQSSPPRRR